MASTTNELVFATNNQHKLEEVQSFLAGRFILKSLKDIGCTDEIPETGNTFYANASQKSNYIVDKYNLNCFADDSGLEIDALNNEPGVYSAHYSGTRDSTYNINLVLQKLGSEINRTARFVTVISLNLNKQEYFFEGAIEGRIITSSTGIEGFGYDPIFIPKGYDKTFAEMSLTEKTKISHRAIAMKKMIQFLTDFTND